MSPDEGPIMAEQWQQERTERCCTVGTSIRVARSQNDRYMNITSSTIIEIVEVYTHRYKWNKVQYILMWVCDTMYGSILSYDLEAGSKLQAINMKLKAQTTGRSLADSVGSLHYLTSSFCTERRMAKQDGLSSRKAVNSEANDKWFQTGNNAGTSQIIIGCLLTCQYLDITVTSVQEVTHKDMENTGWGYSSFTG
ncbi:hypothetical protein IW261DRAFT_1424756 [Armillaria novae-zelandiae]|uniref:Uncharacterized protein n=1 Tax=Armillaria novae-zelandiae TaxID=153914 RepID=A0AA39TWE4_9AGAR|nr:hypothetical protein IW261DRAFT_1424756 [Armillaria novae-zelandiae]